MVSRASISSLVVMGQLRRLQQSEPAWFKRAKPSIIRTLFSGNNYFPRATARLGDADDTDKTFLMRPRIRHFHVVAVIVGVALAMTASLMIWRPLRDLAGLSATGIENVMTGGTTVSTIASGHGQTFEKAEPRIAVALWGRTNADSSKTLSSAAAAPPDTKSLLLASSLRAAKAGNPSTRGVHVHRTASRRASGDWNSDERWLAH
jgi:hypothetical protein